MESLSPKNNSFSQPATPSENFDVSFLANYICRVGSLLLDVPERQLSDLVFSNKETESKLQEFARNVKKLAIFVQKKVPEEEAASPAGDDEIASQPQSPSRASQLFISTPQDSKAELSCSLDLTFTNDRTRILAFVKRNPSKFSPTDMRSEKQVSSQIQAIELGEGSPFDVLHSYVASALEPYFASFAQSRYDFKEGEKKDVQIGERPFPRCFLQTPKKKNNSRQTKPPSRHSCHFPEHGRA